MAESKNRDAAIIAEKEILQKVTIAMRSPAGPKRWFWELLQNAVDTISDEPNRKVNIKVILKKREEGKGATMRFEHDGAPFLESDNPNKFDDFKNLILPRSGKRSSDVKKVGKFGTGFLSTHSLSLKIDVEGAYQSINGEIYEIKTTLDRTYFINEDDKFDSKRIDSIIHGLDNYDDSLKSKKETSEVKTSFVFYLNDDLAIEKVRTGLKDIGQSLPVVLILNSKIGSVHIQNILDNENYVYTPGEHHDLVDFAVQDCVKKEGDSVVKYSVAYKTDGSLTLCWPIEAYKEGAVRFKDAATIYKKSVGDKLPLIYSTFPMIGSNDIKFPVIVHSALFKPNEKRDGVSLTDEKYTDDISKEEIELDLNNKNLFENAVMLYESFITAAAVTAENLYYVLKINGTPDCDWISPSWFKRQISTKLAQVVARIPVIDISENKEDRRSILDDEGEIQVYFPSVSIGLAGEEKEKLNDKFYRFCRAVYGEKIPVKEDLEDWHKILWDDASVIKILEIKDLLSEISDNYKSLKLLSENLNLDRSQTLLWLNDLYKLINDTGNNTLFDEYAIIPNQKGDFQFGEKLRIEDPQSMIDPNIICIIRNLAPEEDWFELLVHRGVINCKYSFEQYSMKKEASDKINELLLQPKNYNDFLNKDSSSKILQRLLSFSFDSESENSNKKQMFNYSQDIFGNLYVRKLTGFRDFKTDNAVKHMIRLINNKIAGSENIIGLAELLNKSKDAAIIWLNGFLNFQIKSEEHEKLIHWANVIPNQHEKFCAHGSEEDRSRMYRPYDITNGNAHNMLSNQLIKNLAGFDPAQDWKAFLVLDGVQLKTLPVKTWYELGTAVDNCIKEISRTVLNDDEEQRQAYRTDLLEVLEWCEYHETTASEYFKILKANADRLYSIISFSPELVSILKNKDKLQLAKRIGDSKLSAATIEKTLDKIEEMHDKLGEGVVEEFLKKAESFIDKKEVFNDRLQLGQNIEELLRNALRSENIDIISDQSDAGSYDIGVYRKSNPQNVLKLEVKSYKKGSSADFSFATSQIVESHGDSLNYIVCTLQRPANEVASIDYLKSNLQVQSNLVGLTAGYYDKIETFHSIYKDSKSGKIPLEIPCVTDPRVKIDHGQLLQNTGDYNTLIDAIKTRLK